MILQRCCVFIVTFVPAAVPSCTIALLSFSSLSSSSPSSSRTERGNHHIVVERSLRNRVVQVASVSLKLVAAGSGGLQPVLYSLNAVPPPPPPPPRLGAQTGLFLVMLVSCQIPGFSKALRLALDFSVKVPPGYACPPGLEHLCLKFSIG